MDLEYAMIARADGTPIANPAKHQAFERFMDAVRMAGGRAPIGSDGHPQLRNEGRGFFDRTERRDMSSGSTASDLTGDGWTVLSTPDDRALEAVAKQIWNIGLRLPWPAGWQVRFANLSGKHDGFAALTLYKPHRLILIDQANYRRRGDEDLETSLHHELTHVACGANVDHDDALFHTTMSELRSRCPRLIPNWTRATR
jgi:hypothetical protein